MVDAEALVTTWLGARLGGVRVVAELPARFEELLPVVRVTCLPGPKASRPWNWSRPLLYQPRIDVDVYSSDRAGAMDLAATVSGRLYDLIGQGNEWGSVKDVDESSGPHWRPDYNTNVRHAGLITTLTVRAE